MLTLSCVETFYSYDVPVLRYDCLKISLTFVLKLVTRSLTHLSRTIRQSFAVYLFKPAHVEEVLGLKSLQKLDAKVKAGERSSLRGGKRGEKKEGEGRRKGRGEGSRREEEREV